MRLVIIQPVLHNYQLSRPSSCKLHHTLVSQIGATHASIFHSFNYIFIAILSRIFRIHNVMMMMRADERITLFYSHFVVSLLNMSRDDAEKDKLRVVIQHYSIMFVLLISKLSTNINEMYYHFLLVAWQHPFSIL